jgi:adenylate cyclase
VADSDVPDKVPDKRTSSGLLGRLRGRLRALSPALATIAAIGAVAGGLVGYWNVWKTLRTDVFREAQKTQREATTRPDIAPRFSLVVLPFANLDNDPEQDYFADAVTTDLTTDLARTPGVFVIGRGTAFTYKNKPVDLKIVGKDLGIRWAVQGAVRRNGDQVRVNVSLTDLQTARDIWSDRFDGNRANLSVLQDQITARLARSLDIELIQAETRRGWAKLVVLSEINNTQAKDLFDRALRLDPDNVEAMIGKATCLAVDATFAFSASVVEDKKQATDLIDKALSKKPGRALAHSVKGDILIFGHPEEALAEYNIALELNPNQPNAHAGKAVALMASWRAQEAVSPLLLALRISPRDPLAFLFAWQLCNVHLHLRQYEEAIDQCGRSITLNNSYPPAYFGLISAYGSTGQMEQAHQALSELDKRFAGNYRQPYPNFTVQLIRQRAYAFSSNPQYRLELDDILDGLKKGGVPER